MPVNAAFYFAILAAISYLVTSRKTKRSSSL